LAFDFRPSRDTDTNDSGGKDAGIDTNTDRDTERHGTCVAFCASFSKGYGDATGATEEPDHVFAIKP